MATLRFFVLTSDSCRACAHMKPAFAELVDTYASTPGVSVRIVDERTLHDIAVTAGVTALPALVCVRETFGVGSSSVVHDLMREFCVVDERDAMNVDAYRRAVERGRMSLSKPRARR